MPLQLRGDLPARQQEVAACRHAHPRGGRACGEIDQLWGDRAQGAIERDAIAAAIVAEDRVLVAAESAAVAVAEAERAVEVHEEGIGEAVAEGLAAERRTQQLAFAECTRDSNAQFVDPTS